MVCFNDSSDYLDMVDTRTVLTVQVELRSLVISYRRSYAKPLCSTARATALIRQKSVPVVFTFQLRPAKKKKRTNLSETFLHLYTLVHHRKKTSDRFGVHGMLFGCGNRATFLPFFFVFRWSGKTTRKFSVHLDFNRADAVQKI